MAYFRLNDKHPTSQALKEVFAKMEEVGISIEIDTYGKLTVTHDDEHYAVMGEEKYRQFTLMDNESPPSGDRDMITSLPPMLEYKLIYEVEEKE